MDYTNDKLQTIKDKLLVTQKYAGYLESMCIEDKEEILKKVERMRNCLDYWYWNMYKENKVLDLLKLNRCKDRYCPNCRSISLAKSIQEFVPYFSEMINKGYNPYLITLTNPNCEDSEMKETLSTMSNGWNKLWKWYFRDRLDGGYADRLFTIKAAVKFTEITRNEKNSNHIHYHILAFTDGNEEADDFRKQYQGEWSTKRQSYDMLSKADLQIRELWYKAYNRIRINLEVDEHYICDIREMTSEKGIYEVFKYCFKDTDIKDYEDFKLIYKAFLGKRIRQGYGELYNAKLEHDEDEDKKEKEDTIEQYLLSNPRELPQKLLTEFKKLLEPLYQDYKKISRFTLNKYLENIDNASLD